MHACNQARRLPPMADRRIRTRLFRISAVSRCLLPPWRCGSARPTVRPMSRAAKRDVRSICAATSTDRDFEVSGTGTLEDPSDVPWLTWRDGHWKSTPRSVASILVCEGDTLSSLAKQRGVPLEELKGLNPEVDMDHIKVGQEIVVRNDDLGAATDRTYARRDPEVPLVRSGQSGEPVVAVETVPFARGPKAEEAGGLKLSMLLIPAAVSLFLGWMGGRWLGDKIEKSGSARARPVGSTSWDQSAAAAASPGRASASPSPSSGDPAPSPPGRASAKAVDEKPGGARWSNWLKPAASAAAAAGEKAMRSVGAKMPGQGVEPRAANAPSDKRNSSGSSANRTKRSIYSPPENSKEQVPRSITQEITQTKTMTQSQSGSAERKQQLQQLQRAQSTLKQLETERTQLQRNMMDKQSKIKMMMDQEGQVRLPPVSTHAPSTTSRVFLGTGVFDTLEC
mmetsp:Transcript_18859/g.36342  ORF Transcript_18859/g.36342 Transcript_18859/m.36342 type:complete len:452 (+) Transcript_18859:419-1774(+)